MTMIKKYWFYQQAILYVLLIILNSCDKDKPPVPTGEQVTDIDGNVYNTITIGSQVWMVEDLKVTKYNDGTTIPYITDNNDWGNNTTGAYTCYNNDKTRNKLYNWFAVNTGKLAPAGWHVSTHEDWTILTNFLGGEDVAGGKLKESGAVHWGSPNIGGSNESGFTALPGGFRFGDGTFSSFGDGGYWWTATDFDALNAWSHYIFSNGSSIKRGHYDKRGGYSIRCIKD